MIKSFIVRYPLAFSCGVRRRSALSWHHVAGVGAHGVDAGGGCNVAALRRAALRRARVGASLAGGAPVGNAHDLLRFHLRGPQVAHGFVRVVSTPATVPYLISLRFFAHTLGFVGYGLFLLRNSRVQAGCAEERA